MKTKASLSPSESPLMYGFFVHMDESERERGEYFSAVQNILT